MGVLKGILIVLGVVCLAIAFYWNPDSRRKRGNWWAVLLFGLILYLVFSK